MKKIFGILSILIVGGIGLIALNEYLANHTYYYSMFSDRTNIKVTFFAFLFALIPIIYLSRFQKKTMIGFLISILIGYLLFGLTQIMIKDQLLGGGFVVFIVNMVLMFVLGVAFIGMLMSLGTWIKKIIFKHEHFYLHDVFISFGLGLTVFLAINYILIMFDLFYGWLVVVEFIAGIRLIYHMRNELKVYEQNIIPYFSGITFASVKKNIINLIPFVLLIFSLVYFYYGFMMSFIPYPTAWDANHAYLYVPKVYSLYHGYLWNWNWEGQSIGVQPMWMAYIAFWFQLFSTVPTWINPDTYAVVMNFLSGPFVLLISLGLLGEVINFIRSHNNDNKENEEEQLSHQSLGVTMGWFVMLLWLTSGMGAFLVFVDNKTDLGVMSLIALAIYSGFVFLNMYEQHKTYGQTLHTSFLSYLIVSGWFFGIAILAKPTAFLDVANFGLLLSFVWLGVWVFIGIALLAMGVLALAKVAGIQDYLTTKQGTYLAGGGFVITLAGLIMNFLKKKIVVIKYMAIWVVTIALTILVIKGPFVTYAAIANHKFQPVEVIKSIFLGYHQDIKKTPVKVLAQNSTVLLASTSMMPVVLDANSASGDAAQPNIVTVGGTNEGCSLDSLHLTTGQLYEKLTNPPESNEDLGRYIGYGQKEFINPWWKVFFGNNVCISMDSSAQKLCESANIINSFSLTGLDMLRSSLSPTSQGYSILNSILNRDDIKQLIQKGTAVNPVQYADDIKQLTDFYKSQTIQTTTKNVSIPYKFMVPFNIVYNWSLQNLSSYYTDIGFVWLPVFFLLVLAFVFALFKRDVKFIAITATTLVGRGIWWMIGSAILWYGIGMIIWTIIALLAFILHLSSRDKQEKVVLQTLIVLFAIAGVLQLVMNFVRMSSQGGAGPFMWYKFNNGKDVIFDQNLNQQSTIKYNYNASDVFNLQFPHYNGIIALSDKRTDGQGILIAGTYLGYFLKNQKNILGDGGLSRLTKTFSDGDTCKSSLRLKDKGLKYLVIDPNIGTIVMGGGNATLFERFFAKIDPVTGLIKNHGTMTMLVKMVQDGYLKLITTNNLGVKYAFGIDDTYLRSKLGISDENMYVLTKARIATVRFWQNADQMVGILSNIFGDRMLNGEAIGDIADVLGKQINLEAVQTAASQLLGKQYTQDAIQAATKNLSDDDRNVLAQYLGLYQRMQNNKDDFKNIVNQFIMNSIGGGSQLIVFEVK